MDNIDMANYDSRTDTINHINRVKELSSRFCAIFLKQVTQHDKTKLESPEKELFDKYTPLLKSLTYGSDEYKQSLNNLQVALKHHYDNNSHHPEHYVDGVNDMTLFDIIEMFCDWKAATERHADGDLNKSFEINKDRFKINDQLIKIFQNTAKKLEWTK